jgi:hypothetical protein
MPTAGGDTGNVQEKAFLINCPELQGGGSVDAGLARTYGKNQCHSAEILSCARVISRQC